MYFERAILATPYEIGYREGAPQVITQMLIDGDNYAGAKVHMPRAKIAR